MMNIKEVKVLIIENISSKKTKADLIRGLNDSICLILHTEIDD